MTKKDYELIASQLDTVKSIFESNDMATEAVGVEGVAFQLAMAFSKENPLFSRAKFLKACNVKEI